MALVRSDRENEDGSAWTPGVSRPPVVPVVMQHVDDAIQLRRLRSLYVRAPHIRLAQLASLDERLLANLDGIAVSSDVAAGFISESLQAPDSAATFVAAVHAIQTGDAAGLDRLLDTAEGKLDEVRALESAFGWVAPGALRGLVKELLKSDSAWRRAMGLGACANHGVDAGIAITNALRHEEPLLRGRGALAAQACGRIDLAYECLESANFNHQQIEFLALRSAVMLGVREPAIDPLVTLALHEAAAPFRSKAVSLLAAVADADVTQAVLAESIARGHLREAIGGIAVLGDVRYVDWLFTQLCDPNLARVAGEAVETICGLDISAAKLDRSPPADVSPGPSNDPDDDDTSMDVDEHLPWPDLARMSNWWASSAVRLMKQGRVFMGAELSDEHCLAILRTGRQRQRAIAACWLALRSPDRPSFNVAAPASRQLRRLGMA